jgi:CheY-like chemotaxis protein
VITDHEMPEMDGLMLAQRLREMGIATPILLLSSNPAAARERPGAEHLAALLQKPILRADLYRHLQGLSLSKPELASGAAPTDRRQMRVLAAEDNRTNQLVFQKMVREADIDLVFANNGVEAVTLYQSFRPDLIFMDISMPEMDGREASRAIRALEGGRGHVPIIAVTAHAMDGDAGDILAAGIDRYLTKPLRKVSIMETLVEHCPKAARQAVPDAADSAA